MDIPLDVGATGRSQTPLTKIFENWCIAYTDTTGGTYTTGLPGITIDSRTSGQPQYSNNISLGGLLDTASTAPVTIDNTGLASPGGPVLFIATKGAGSLAEFVRLSPEDITDGNVGVWLQKVVTGEDCANTGAYRWFLCSQLLTP